jgi:hypothetical protein
MNNNNLGVILRARREERGLSLVKLGKLSELCKLAGFIPRDATDDRLDRFKKSVKKEIIETLVNLGEKIDKL